jgi:type VI secretion system protein ImpH
MMTHEEISGYLQALQSDIRFEVILADLISENLNMDDVAIESESLFKRNYHHDVENTSIVEYGAGKKKKLRFALNREGIYDQLPEDLFHQISDTKTVTDTEEFIQEIREHSDLEKSSRIFFQPIEHEFYSQRIKLEIEERKFSFETNHVLSGDIFNYLWDLPEFLDDLQKSKLGLLMPVIFKLTGKKHLLPFIFESITGDPVEIRETTPHKYKMNDSPVLGNMHLSLDSILDGNLAGLQSGFIIVIFVADVEKLLDYMPGGKKMIVHEFLCNLFMPLDSEIVFETDFPEATSSFLIEGDTVFQGRLNYSTII